MTEFFDCKKLAEYMYVKEIPNYIESSARYFMPQFSVLVIVVNSFNYMDNPYIRTIFRNVAKCEITPMVISYADNHNDTNDYAVYEPYKSGSNKLSTIVDFINHTPRVGGAIFVRPYADDIREMGINLRKEKDIDCFTKNSIFKPCISEAIIKVYDEISSDYKLPKEGLNITILGNSEKSTKPVIQHFLDENKHTIHVCNSKTSNSANLCRHSDVIISAIGQPKFLNEDYLWKDQVIIDAGTSFKDGKLCGDLDVEVAKRCGVKVATAIPNGLGHVTTAFLIKHTLIGLNASEFADRR